MREHLPITAQGERHKTNLSAVDENAKETKRGHAVTLRKGKGGGGAPSLTMTTTTTIDSSMTQQAVLRFASGMAFFFQFHRKTDKIPCREIGSVPVPSLFSQPQSNIVKLNRTCSLLETPNAAVNLSAECPITSFVENSATAGACQQKFVCFVTSYLTRDEDEVFFAYIVREIPLE